MAKRGSRNIFERYPGLHEFLSDLVARDLVGKDLEDAVAERFGVRFTASALRTAFRRWPAGPPAERILQPVEGYHQNVVVDPPKHPKGWEPHVEERGNEATAVSQPTEKTEQDIDEAWLISQWNLDPKQWRIVGPLNCRRWQSSFPVASAEGCRCDPKINEPHNESRWLHYYKANLGRVDPVVDREVSGLLDAIARHRPAKKSPATGESAFAVCFADLQMGKGDGDGVEGTTQRALDAIDSVRRRYRNLRKIGHGFGALYIFGLGDLIENCDGFYDQQAFRTTLNRRDQVKLARRVIAKSIETWAPDFERVVVAAVGGNHGENRRDGKSFTDFADNDDVAIFEQLEDVFSQNLAAYDHLSFAIPRDDLTITLDVAGTVTAISHGHQAGKSSDVMKKIVEWWKGQALGMQPAGDATLLITGHHHFYAFQSWGRRIHFQCPALEGGSDWYRNRTGNETTPGILTLAIGSTYRDGFSNPEVV